jgi:hypothetical protein
VVELNEQAAIAKDASPSNAKALMVELLFGAVWRCGR